MRSSYANLIFAARPRRVPRSYIVSISRVAAGINAACELDKSARAYRTEVIVRYNERRNGLSPRCAGWVRAFVWTFGLIVCSGSAFAQITLPGAGMINTVAGVGTAVGDNRAATSAQLNNPLAVVLDPAGNVYIADTYNNRIRKVTVSSGIIITLAGNGAGGSSGDGGLATSAQLNTPSGVALDSAGNVYIADSGNNRVRKITASTGIITTVAGNGLEGYSGDDGAATNAELSYPSGLALDSAGNLYIADLDNSVIRKVSKASGMITTVAGNGAVGYSGDGGPAATAELSYPSAVALDVSGNIYIADQGNNCIRKVTVSTGIITTFAGNGTGGYSGDGGAATSAELSTPGAVALDSTGNLYIADSYNHRIRKVTIATGVMSTLAGTGWPSYCCDGGPALDAELHFPAGIALDPAGNLYIADTDNSRIRKVTVSSSIINTIAGSDAYSGDGGPATSALLSYPFGVVADPSGNLYIGDDGNCRVRKVTASTRTITTFAGNGVACDTTGGNWTGDGGPAINAQLGAAEGLALDSAGNLYIAAGGSIRKVTPAGIISTSAGSYLNGYSGDGGPATSAVLSFPEDVAVDSAGNLYIADTDNNRIRKVTFSTGIINTVAGNGTAGYSGDGVAATSTELNYPTGVALDGAGNLYIADAGNYRIRKVTVSTGLITTVAGNGNCAFSGDGGLAKNAALCDPADVKLDSAGNLYIADYYNNRIRKVTAATGIITTIAGNGILGYSGDGGLAIGAELDSPVAVALNSTGDLYIADQYNGRIRAVGPITTTPTVWDTGTVSLLVNNSPLAIATYGEGSTSATVAAALATSAGSVTNSPVKVTAVDDALYLEATTAGVAGNAISYSLRNTAYTSSEFSAPSFPAAASSGTLAAGDAQGANSGKVIYKYTTQFDGANNLISDSDQVMGSWIFHYDTLNRLMTATDNETGDPNTNYCWGYDPFGNRTIQAGSSAAFQVGSPTCTPAGTASYNGTWAQYSTANNNQLANTIQAPGGVSYDASGDVVNDGVNQYLYDGEGRICAVAYTPITGDTVLTGYVYNASGERVSKGAITTLSCDPAISGFTATNDYVLGPSGEQVTEMAMNANNTMAWQHTNVYAAGNLFATYDNNGLHFYFNDVVGTRRIQTDYAGVMEQSCSGLPFGDSLTCSASVQFPTEHHFTGKERDSESGLDYFGARYYTSNLGRFMSPDPSGLAYADPTNPQSLNLYAYVANNPLTNTDPSGMECVWGDGSFDSEDDPATGSSEGCTGQGGTYVPPNLFQNATLSNGQWRSNWGDWSSQANSNLAQNWLNPSSTTNAVPDNSITLAVPMDVWNFAAQQTTPVSGLWTYGNWAGPGGMGAPVNDADAGAMMHDYCYHQGGFTSSTNFGPPNSALQACNQALCDTESSIASGQGQNMDETVQGSNGMLERYAAQDMVNYFSNVPFKGNTCKK
jgi:trimeric autotransporter adhesin